MTRGRRATDYYARHHKKMAFYPTGLQGVTKREINKQLVAHRKDIDGRVADKYYFRIYKHKGQRYTLYIGPEKITHGGLRRRSKTGKTKTTTKPQTTQKSPKLVEKSDVEKTLESYTKIESGPHSGKFKHNKTGDILTERQLRIAIATTGGL